MEKEKKGKLGKKVIFTGIVSIICAGLGIFCGLAVNNHQNSEININIINALNDGSSEVISETDLQTSASHLIDSYNNVKQENKAQAAEINDLQNDYNQLQRESQALQTTNETLSEEIETLNGQIEMLSKENEKIKAFLLHDNTYANDIDDLVIVKQTYDRLENLQVNDSQNYSVVDGVKDYHGDSHSVSYQLDARDTAFVEYKLSGKYDLFNASIITTTETSSDVLFSVEVYLDDSYYTRIDDITRETSLVSLGPIVVRDVDRLKFKVVKIEGDYYDKAICYITDDSLSVVQ